MRQTLMRLAKLTAGYSLVTLLGPIVTILLVPLYTRVLAPADYGVVDIALTFASLIGICINLGIDQALNAFFFDDGPDHQRNLITTAALFAGGCGLVAGMAMAALATPLAVALFKDADRSPIFYLLALSSITSAIYGIMSAGLRLQMRVKRVNVLGLTNLAATVVINIALILVLHLGATGIIIANVVTSLIVCVLSLILARDVLFGRFSRALLLPLVRTGLHLLPGTVSVVFLLQVDRLMLTQFVSTGDIGLYSIANKLASMIWVVFSAVGIAWNPMALEMANQPDAPRQYARVFEYSAVAWMWSAFGLGLFSPEILTIFTRPAYVPAAPYALALFIFNGPVSMAAGYFGTILFACKRTRWMSLPTITAGAVNVILNLILDPVFGVWGAVWATVIAGGVMMIGLYWLSWRGMRVPYRMSKVLVLFTVYLVLVAAFLIVSPLHTVPIKLMALFALSVSVLLTGLISRRELAVGWQLLCGRVARLIVSH
jgi:O-antigen/teichoic acid export membrane protein